VVLLIKPTMRRKFWITKERLKVLIFRSRIVFKKNFLKRHCKHKTKATKQCRYT